MKLLNTFSEVAEKYNPENDKIFERACEMLDERLDGAVGEYGSELHDYVFNVEAAFEYANLAENAVDSVGVWSAIRLVHAYETGIYDKFFTEIDAIPVANMLVYIYGRFILDQSKHLQNRWDDELTADDLDKIRKEIIEWCMTTLPDNKASFARPLDGLVWDEYGTY